MTTANEPARVMWWIWYRLAWTTNRYNPMRKEGAIGLGTGGDNSNSAQGNFFEGVMTAAYSSDAADDAVQASIVSVYGQ